MQESLAPKKKKHRAKKAKRLCKDCGRPIRQAYYQRCIYCRKALKERKKLAREIRKTLKEALT